MAEIITYSLRDGQKRSDQYYKDIAAFAGEVLTATDSDQMLIADFQTFIQKNNREILRTQPEYAFEFLTLGVLWRVYIKHAIKLSEAPQRFLASLSRLRKKYKFLKAGIDFLRGRVGTIFLLPNNRHACQMPPPTLENLAQLLKWLAATGEFYEEVKRLSTWRDFLGGLPPEGAAIHLNRAISLASWFEVRSLKVLGGYTQNVERFLTETHPRYRWREDMVFCGRQRVEYHLNMVGTEILNCSFREKFLKTARKIVLLPPCMKARSEDECQAHETPFGERCAECTPGCRVHQATKLGEKHGFAVLVMPHELNVFSDDGEKLARQNPPGIVGVSCPLTNVTGGWETKGMGVPAQGVLLDYCGCRWHWHDDGIPTEINLKQLLEVLDIRD